MTESPPKIPAPKSQVMTVWCNMKMPAESIIYFIAVFSAMITIFVGIAGVSSWNETGSSLMLGLGMINIVELFRNIIVMWRFFRLTDDSIEILKRDDRSR